MNCKSCNTSIDYRFLTKCGHCDSEIESIGVPAIRSPAPVERHFTWIHGLINLAYVFVSSIAGMISGAVVIYVAGGIAYLALFSHVGSGNSSEECARGTAIAMLLILSGALLGTVGGCVFAVKNLVFKPTASSI